VSDMNGDAITVDCWLAILGSGARRGARGVSGDRENGRRRMTGGTGECVESASCGRSTGENT
jgi:hypothetical protein